MAETTKIAVTRTVTLSDLTPAEMASIYAAWDNELQAEFFHHIAAEAKDWPGGGWMMQALYIADNLSPEGARIVRELAESIREEVQ
jgi:hypothetical protein